MAYAKINSVTNANMAKVSSAAKAALGKIGSIDAPSSFANEYSISFDGSNDYVTMGDIDILDGQDTFTISTWINLAAHPASGNRYVVISKDNAYELYVRNYSDDIKIYLRLNNGTVDLTGATGIDVDTWYHVAAVHNSGGTDIYLNGSAIGSGLGSQITVNNTSDAFVIGGRGSYDTNGLIDEVALWTTDLDAGAISAIYNSGTPTDLSGESNLVGYWRFEEGTGTTVADDSSNSNTGTLTNQYPSPDIVWSSDTP